MSAIFDGAADGANALWRAIADDVRAVWADSVEQLEPHVGSTAPLVATAAWALVVLACIWTLVQLIEFLEDLANEPPEGAP